MYSAIRSNGVAEPIAVIELNSDCSAHGCVSRRRTDLRNRKRPVTVPMTECECMSQIVHCDDRRVLSDHRQTEVGLPAEEPVCQAAYEDFWR